ncbi:MAG: hypothetical protein GX089_17445 [Fibrobacter sp.]|nr:hypothetical protein [Fibrobacter sp.]
MKNRISLLIMLICTITFTGKTSAQTASIDQLSLFNFDLQKIQLFSGSNPVINIDEQSSPKKGGIVVGSLMITSGTVLTVVGYYVGKESYSRYKKSAFTENTDQLRKKVNGFNAMRITGGILAGAGLIVIVVSF